MRSPHLPRRLLLAGAAALSLAVVVAGPASAHVVVTSPDGTPGGFGTLVFRVPSESASASTVKITVDLPADAPLADVSAEVHQGWQVSTTERKLPSPVTTDDGFTVDKAVATVTWTASSDAGVPPGQFDEFALSVGPFPSKARQKLAFPTVQTYSDGSVVRWDQPTTTGKAEPEHPAPALTLDAGGAPVARVSAAPQQAAAAPDSDHTARWTALGAAGVAVVALLVACGAFVTARKS